MFDGRFHQGDNGRSSNGRGYGHGNRHGRGRGRGGHHQNGNRPHYGKRNEMRANNFYKSKRSLLLPSMFEDPWRDQINALVEKGVVSPEEGLKNFTCFDWNSYNSSNNETNCEFAHEEDKQDHETSFVDCNKEEIDLDDDSYTNIDSMKKSLLAQWT